MIALKIFLFAGAREIVHAEAIQVDVSLPIKIADIREKLGIEFPALQSLLAISRFAVDREFVSDAFELFEPSSEIAIIPPVSGG